MTVELECKVRVESHDPIRAKLRAAGATYVGRVLETNALFDRQDGRLRKAGCGLRVRSVFVLDGEGSGASLTYKGPRLRPRPKTTLASQTTLAPKTTVAPRRRRHRRGACATRLSGRTLSGAFKCREEIEVAVDNPEATASLLHALDYTEQIVFEKRRESWRLEACRVELDELPRLGRFVEVEGPSEDAIRLGLARLGLAEAAPIRESYVSMVAGLSASSRSGPVVLRFE